MTGDQLFVALALHVFQNLHAIVSLEPAIIPQSEAVGRCPFAVRTASSVAEISGQMLGLSQEPFWIALTEPLLPLECDPLSIPQVRFPAGKRHASDSPLTSNAANAPVE